MSEDGLTKKIYSELQPDGAFATGVSGSATIWKTTVLTVGTWTAYSFHFAMKNDQKTTRSYQYLNGVVAGSGGVATLTSKMSFSDKDKFTIGGTPSPSAVIGNIKMYSPGSTAIFSTSWSPSCLKSIGVTNPPACLIETCGTGCTTCMDSSNCLSCTDSNKVILNGQCSDSCGVGYFVSGTICRNT